MNPIWEVRMKYKIIDNHFMFDSDFVDNGGCLIKTYKGYFWIPNIKIADKDKIFSIRKQKTGSNINLYDIKHEQWIWTCVCLGKDELDLMEIISMSPEEQHEYWK